MKMIAVFLLALALGCGNNRNPVHVQTTDTATPVAEHRDLRVVNTTPAPAAKATVNLTHEQLELTVTSTETVDGVALSIAAESGVIISRDLIKIFFEDNGEEIFWGQLEVSPGLAPIIMIDIVLWNGFPADRPVIVRIKRHGEILAEGRTDDGPPRLSMTNTVFKEDPDLYVVIESVTILNSKTLSVSFGVPFKMTNRRITLSNLHLWIEDMGSTMVLINDIDEVDGNLIIITEDDLVPGGTYEITYHGRPGFVFEGFRPRQSHTLFFTFMVEEGNADADPSIPPLGIAHAEILNGNTLSITFDGGFDTVSHYGFLQHITLAELVDESWYREIIVDGADTYNGTLKITARHNLKVGIFKVSLWFENNHTRFLTLYCNVTKERYETRKDPDADSTLSQFDYEATGLVYAPDANSGVIDGYPWSVWIHDWNKIAIRFSDDIEIKSRSKVLEGLSLRNYTTGEEVPINDISWGSVQLSISTDEEFRVGTHLLSYRGASGFRHGGDVLQSFEHWFEIVESNDGTLIVDLAAKIPLAHTPDANSGVIAEHPWDVWIHDRNKIAVRFTDGIEVESRSKVLKGLSIHNHTTGEEVLINDIGWKPIHLSISAEEDFQTGVHLLSYRGASGFRHGGDVLQSFQYWFEIIESNSGVLVVSPEVKMSSRE